MKACEKLGYSPNLNWFFDRRILEPSTVLYIYIWTTHDVKPWNQNRETTTRLKGMVDGRNPAPPGMVKTLWIMG